MRPPGKRDKRRRKPSPAAHLCPLAASVLEGAGLPAPLALISHPASAPGSEVLRGHGLVLVATEGKHRSACSTFQGFLWLWGRARSPAVAGDALPMSLADQELGVVMAVPPLPQSLPLPFPALPPPHRFPLCPQELERPGPWPRSPGTRAALEARAQRRCR